MMDQQTSAALFNQVGGPRFELIPANHIVERATAALPPHATLTITCSPTNGIDATIDKSIALAAHFAKVVPHIAARMVRSEEHLNNVLDRLADQAIHEVFIIGGDQEKPLGPYHHGLELLKALATRENGPRRIGIPAYPEGHPHIRAETLNQDFAAKASLAHYAVTQMCFDTEQVFAWLQQQRASGLQLPYYLGIPGPVKLDKLLRIAPRIGVTDSLRFLRKNLKLSTKLIRGYDPGALVNAYTPYLNESDYGIAGFHIYTFNELDTLQKVGNI
ncbi:methylenetetrahydrofolate reductase [Virgibacillus sp. NKC19-3]|uniref:methylenetetrahydrofolate reductase n=1 Tax=Virgibacillus saliphilus TaxID=2831674 RepID=UPI001C9A744B|nr:methylenetetrahydrofolate reductase [Virgibacillus sp. NKC19-3]MBY7141750.1 methylenetetrahydrofolate reductase [Virgibacillus sp. NKC19-3]